MIEIREKPSLISNINASGIFCWHFLPDLWQIKTFKHSKAVRKQASDLLGIITQWWKLFNGL